MAATEGDQTSAAALPERLRAHHACLPAAVAGAVDDGDADGQAHVGAADRVAGALVQCDGQRRAARAAGDQAAIADELGDVLMSVVSVARHLGVDPELALRAAAGKFRRRFEAVERAATAERLDLRGAGLERLDALWDDAKHAGPTA